MTGSPRRIVSGKKRRWLLRNLFTDRLRDPLIGGEQSRTKRQMYKGGDGEWLETACSSMKTVLRRNSENGAMAQADPCSGVSHPERTGTG